MMKELEKLFQAKDPKIKFSHNGNRVRCFPHVINISVKTGLSVLTCLSPILDGSKDNDGITANELSTPDISNNLASTSEYREALGKDLISTVRQLVNTCRASGNRRDDFRDIVINMQSELQAQKAMRSGNLSENLEKDDVLERVVVLLRDVDTRWSSIFFMVDRFLELYPAVERFINENSAFDSVMLPNNVDLIVLNDIRKYLHAFHCVQEAASAEKTPTLAIVLPLYEELIEILKAMKMKLPNLSHVIDASLQKLFEYVNKARSTRVYALAMGRSHSSKICSQCS
ncbi:hypothetical protein C8J55DRAFT_413443 [Lentinula edodes]|uniref:Uncharacterized protein n=1 Tax=Lentinula lateritia TaxID=40482 RepID=A0A9W9E0Z9_9AGAR|nr:hypothetical protein C8J55DRAFT_413443 [Lentinula edodes]